MGGAPGEGAPLWDKDRAGGRGGLRPDARILQEVDEDGKGDVPCAENCGWMVPT